jgi:hypothetical protein
VNLKSIEFLFKNENILLFYSIITLIYGFFLLIRRKPIIYHSYIDYIMFAFFASITVIQTIIEHYNNHSFFIAFILGLFIGRITRPYTFGVTSINTNDFKEALLKTLDALSLKRSDYDTQIYIENPDIDILLRYEKWTGEVKLNFKNNKRDYEQVKKIVNLLKENIMSDKVKFKYVTSLIFISFGIIFLGLAVLSKFVLHI